MKKSAGKKTVELILSISLISSQSCIKQRCLIKLPVASSRVLIAHLNPLAFSQLLGRVIEPAEMKKDILTFFAAIVILGGTFAGYFNWLRIQPTPGVVQIKVPPKSPPAPPKQEARQVIEDHPTISWHSLDFMQQEALAPISQQWDSLPELQQHRLLKTAKHYPNLTFEQKQRFYNRLEAWSKLTPEQRKAAREKYFAFSQVSAEKREQVKQMALQNQSKKAQQLASSVPTTPLPLQP